MRQAIVYCLAVSAATVSGYRPAGARVNRVASDVVITACRFGAGDVDGDGRGEIVVAGRVGPYAPTASPAGIDICRHTPDVGLTVIAATAGPDDITDIAVGDVDGDGAADIAVVAGSSLHLLRLVGDDVLMGPIRRLGPGRLNRVDVADLDGDGRAEIAVVEVLANWGSEVSSSRLTVLSGAQGLAPMTSIDLDGHVGDLCFGDFDGDGEAELAVELGFEELGGLVRTFGFDGPGDIHEERQQQLSRDGARILNLSALAGAQRALMATGDTGGRVTVWVSEAARFRALEHFSLPRAGGLFHGLQFASPSGRRLLAATARVGESRGGLWELISEGGRVE